MSIEAMRELKTLASVCPELNMANYTEDDVRHLNDWAIEMSLLVEQYALSQQPATGVPVYWEWRHLSTHPDTVDFGQWSEWKRVEARSAIHTIEDALAEFRAYIAQGYKYELRALYDHQAPSVPMTNEQWDDMLGSAGPDMLDLAKQWADNKVHVYQVVNKAEKIVKAAVLRGIIAQAKKKDE